MAPAHAARIFRERFPGAASFDVTLFGSLAATGKGHFTDKAIMQTLAPHPVTLHWIPEKQLPFHPNAMELLAGFGGNIRSVHILFGRCITGIAYRNDQGGLRIIISDGKLDLFFPGGRCRVK